MINIERRVFGLRRFLFIRHPPSNIQHPPIIGCQSPCKYVKFKKGVPVIVKGVVTGAVNPTTITIKVDGQSLGTCSAAGDGTWKWTTSSPWGWNTSSYSRGDHTVTADAQDSLGRTGSHSHTVRLIEMAWPCSGTVTQEFSSGSHNGIDIANSTGTDIGAAESGTVSGQSYDSDGYGYYRTINHGTIYTSLIDGSTTSYDSATVTTLYAHMISNSSNPSSGANLDRGSFVGDMDCSGFSTCSHVHFEVREGTAYADAVDPRDWISGNP